MTESELKAEYDYRVRERLGILCEGREPTTEQLMMAREEAWAAIEELRKEVV